MILKNNQYSAINAVLDNNFKSGVIAHATGTGKSVIGINLINEYIKYNNNANIMWLCEFKTIINELFNNKLFCDILSKLDKNYNIFNYSSEKNKDWTTILNNKSRKI